MNPVFYLIQYCGGLKQNERLLILYDSSTESLLKHFVLEAEKITDSVYTRKIELSALHGIEPPKEIASEMVASNLILCLTKSSLAHTEARKKATDRGSRFLSMPDYSEELLSSDAVLFPYKEAYPQIRRVSERLTMGNSITVRSEKGTSIKMDISHRVGNCCPGFVTSEIRLGSPPDAEANIAPVEENSHGVIVIDGSITHPDLCKLRSPVSITVKGGRAVGLKSDCTENVQKLEKIFRDVDKANASVLAECGIGFNRRAKLCGNMLVDEGTYGCVHFGFGSNDTIGGKNKINFHLDFVMTKPTLFVDQQILIESGEIVL